MKTVFSEINFSPFANNVLDWIDRPNLVTFDGRPVKLTRNGMKFIVVIGEEKVYEGTSNLSASYALNMNRVGELSYDPHQHIIDKLREY